MKLGCLSLGWGVGQGHKMVKYTGTIASYNKLVDYLHKTDGFYHIYFADKNNNITPKFTGVVMCAIRGVKYSPGDHYMVPIKNKRRKK